MKKKTAKQFTPSHLLSLQLYDRENGQPLGEFHLLNVPDSLAGKVFEAWVGLRLDIHFSMNTKPISIPDVLDTSEGMCLIRAVYYDGYNREANPRLVDPPCTPEKQTG